MFLLLASNTLVGQAFAAELQFRRQSFAVCEPETTDLWDVNVLYEQIRRVNPEFIINAALVSQPANGSLTREDKETALRSNVLLPQTLARVCQMRNIPWGHVSSGTIFRGAKVLQDSQWLVEINLHTEQMQQRIRSQPDSVLGFSETDEPNHCFLCPPCDFHSGTIALGERAIQGVGNNYTWRPGVFICSEAPHYRQPTPGQSATLNAQRSPLNQFGSTGSKTHRPTVPPAHRFTETPKHRNTETPRHRPTVPPSPRTPFQPIHRLTDAPTHRLFSVTHLGDFVSACLDLWEGRAPYGTYHIANPGLVSAKDLSGVSQDNAIESGNGSASTPITSPGFLLETSKLAALGTELRPAAKALNEVWDSLRHQQPPRDHSVASDVRRL